MVTASVEQPASNPRRKPNPFKPPREVKEFEALQRTGGGGVSKGYAAVLRVLAVMLSFTVIGLVFAIPMFLMAAALERGGAKAVAAVMGLKVKGKTGRWFEQLAESRAATFADIGTYLGGHPFLPIRGKCALYALRDSLMLEVEGGGEAVIGYSSMSVVDTQVFPDGSALGAITYTDDRGGTNFVRFTGTWGNPVGDWVSFLNAARYHGELV